MGSSWTVFEQIDVFILDFEKSFDTVPHKLVKTKLHSIGASKQTIKWIDQFLDNGQQTVWKWGVRFQPTICNIMSVTKIFLFDYTLEGTKLQALDDIKYLSVTIRGKNASL